MGQLCPGKASDVRNNVNNSRAINDLLASTGIFANLSSIVWKQIYRRCVEEYISYFSPEELHLLLVSLRKHPAVLCIAEVFCFYMLQDVLLQNIPKLCVSVVPSYD
jgi:hypothetical protein